MRRTRLSTLRLSSGLLLGAVLGSVLVVQLLSAPVAADTEAQEVADADDKRLSEVRVSFQSDGTALVSWPSMAEIGADGFYRVRRNIDGDQQGYEIVARRVEDAQDEQLVSWVDENVDSRPGRSYLYSVRGFDATGKQVSRWSTRVQLYVAVDLSDASLTWEEDDGQARLRWTAPKGIVSGVRYAVRRAGQVDGDYDVIEQQVQDSDGDGLLEYVDNLGFQAFTGGDNYFYGVRAYNGEGRAVGPWTPSMSLKWLDRGRRQVMNRPPTFATGRAWANDLAAGRPWVFRVRENQPSGEPIRTPEAGDPDTSDTLTYSLGGADAAQFNIDSSTGLITTKRTFDYETKSSYTLVYTATDLAGASVSAKLRVNILDEREPPSSPTAVTVTPGQSSLTVSWTPPVTTGIPPVYHYRVSYQRNAFHVNPWTWGRWIVVKSITGTSYELTNLMPGEKYRVAVLAVNDDGLSEWSSKDPNTGRIVNYVHGTPLGTKATPIFADGHYTSREVIEGAAIGSAIGSAVTAADPEGDTLTYSLGPKSGSVTIEASTGQLYADMTFNCQRWNLYGATVIATDPNGNSESIDVYIVVTDSSGTICPYIW